MEPENDRKRELLPGCIFNDFGAIWDPPKRPKIDQNGRGTLGDSVFVVDCVAFLDRDQIFIDFDPIWTPLGSIFDDGFRWLGPFSSPNAARSPQ